MVVFLTATAGPAAGLNSEGAGRLATQGWIAFRVEDPRAHSGVWLIRPDGSGLHRIGRKVGIPKYGISWVPDGSALLLGTERVDEPEAWLVPLDRSSPTQLPEIDGRIYFPTLGPDGETIVFGSNRNSWHQNVWTMRPDGTELRRRTWFSYSYVGGFSWTSDGSTVVFWKQDGTSPTHIAVLRFGERVRYLTDTSLSYSADLSPDDRWVVYADSSPFTGYPAHLYLVPFEGGAPRRITAERGADSPSFSPDGRRVAYVHDGAIWIVGVGGHGAHAVTGDLGVVDLAWSPTP
jgi:Tol biopolymer transport system component